MSPTPLASWIYRRDDPSLADPSQRPTDPEALVLEAWAEGYMIGSLIIMTCITLANMRRGVLLHKLILIELVFGFWQGVYILFDAPIYAWWLSVAAVPLNISWCLHNVIAWMKLRPFLSKTWSRLFIGTICLSFPYWVVEIYANFTYFHNINDMFLKTRPWEALCRDPWWIGAAVFLMYNIKTKYDLSLVQIVRISPRFAVMLLAMCISIVFIVLDVCSVTDTFKSALPIGINPFWKLSFVFKCLTDSVVLDDFKTALDRLRAFKISRLGSFAIDGGDRRSKTHYDAVYNANNWADPPPVPVGELPRIPIADDGEFSPTWNKGSDLTAHIEDHERPDVVRTASRDRDYEENGIKIIDHAETIPAMDSKHGTHIEERRLQSQDSWPLRTSNGSDDLDIEYAMAVRQMTNEQKSSKR